MFTDRRANSLTTRRVRQPWPKNRTFKILSLDGGGIKGIYTAELLCLCEDRFCNDEPIARHFDLIAGTSTGGIIALALGLDFTASEIKSFYRDDGRTIFPPLPSGRRSRLKYFLGWIRESKLDHDSLESALKQRFGEALLGHSRARLVIPAFMMPKTEIAVLKTDHHADFRNDYLTPMWKAARSTSAAPTYLKGLEDKESEKIFIDDGVWANNPVMVAIVDALSCYDLSFNQIEVLSIGTGNGAFELQKSQAFGGLWAWREVIKAAMFLTTDNAISQATLLLGPDKCLRLEPGRAAATIEMDDYDTALSLLPGQAARVVADREADIAHYFENIVAPRERHYTVGW